MAGNDLFDDLEDFDDLGDLDEVPSFDFGDEESIEFAAPQEEGISRTFKVVGAVIGLGVVLIVVLLIVFALSGGSDKPTANEKTSAAIVAQNATDEAGYNMTLTALALIEQATQTQVRALELTGTAQDILAQTQQAQRATDQAATAAAQAVASQTAVVFQTQTQEAVDQNMTASAIPLRLVGQVVDPEGNPVGNVTLRLYKDNGDGVFTPADRIPTPTPAAGQPGTTGEAQSIEYGQIAEGTLARGEVASWTFNGTKGDSIIINAIAADPVQMDMFLELIGPDGSLLTGDDDSGEGSNAAITGFTLPQDGKYTIHVSSVAGPGNYTLLLSLGLTTSPGPVAQPTTEESVPTATAENPAEMAPTQETGGSSYHVPSNGIVLASNPVYQDTPPPPTPTGDELIQAITAATNGTFDFGALEPGATYWLELDYNSLPPNLQALVPAGQPLVIKVMVPVQGGSVQFQINAPTPAPPATPTSEAGLSEIEMTASAFSPLVQPSIVTLTSTGEPSGTLATQAMPETGFFSDISGGGAGSGTSGLTVLAIAGAGLIAVVFIARKLRTST